MGRTKSKQSSSSFWYSRSRAASAPTTPRPEPAADDPPIGCMSMVHYLIFAPGAGCVGRPPSSSNAIVTPHNNCPGDDRRRHRDGDNNKMSGFEAPRNSLDLDADNPNDIQIGVQIEPAFDALARTNLRRHKPTAPSSEAETPRTPSLVARLMGIDGLPDQASPSPASNKKPSSKKHAVVADKDNCCSAPVSNRNSKEKKKRGLPSVRRGVEHGDERVDGGGELAAVPRGGARGPRPPPRRAPGAAVPVHALVQLRASDHSPPPPALGLPPPPDPTELPGPTGAHPQLATASHVPAYGRRRRPAPRAARPPRLGVRWARRRPMSPAESAWPWPWVDSAWTLLDTKLVLSVASVVRCQEMFLAIDATGEICLHQQRRRRNTNPPRCCRRCCHLMGSSDTLFLFPRSSAPPSISWNAVGGIPAPAAMAGGGSAGTRTADGPAAPDTATEAVVGGTSDAGEPAEERASGVRGLPPGEEQAAAEGEGEEQERER